jgi:hypothetical protein
MSITSVSAKELAKLGANLEITADADFTSPSVKEIVKIVVSKGKHITVHAGPYTSPSLKEMVKIGGDNITIAI